MALYTVNPKNTVGKDHHTYIYSLPTDYYGGASGEYTGYSADPSAYWSNKDSNNNANSFWFTVQDNFTSSDTMEGGNAGGSQDVFYAGLGDDSMDGRGGSDRLIGGGGNDQMSGGGNADVIYGDWTNVVETVDGTAPPTTSGSTTTSDWLLLPFDPYNSDGSLIVYGDGKPSSDKRNEDLSLAGDDTIFGGSGSDTILGGPGNDQIAAGPHGQSNPYTDDVSGGTGSDAFLLSYDSSSAGAGVGYWGEFTGSTLFTTAANKATSTAISDFAKNATSEALSNVGSSVMFAAAGAVGGALVSAGLDLILGLDKSSTPKNAQDVTVIRDFDPSEDTLFLPIDLSNQTSLTVTPVFVNASAAGTSDLEGYALNFSATALGTLNYAQVFLDTENYLAAFNDVATLSQDDIKQLLSNLLLTATNIDTGGYQDTQTVDPFGESDPDAPAYEAPPDTMVQVLGAYGPISIVGPGGTGNGIVVGGTQYGDVISINDTVFLPQDYESFDNTGQVSHERSLILGFDGDDVLYGGAASDVIHGDGGDDLIYGFDASTGASGDVAENLFGGDGDDQLYGLAGAQVLNGGAGSDRLDGGSGSDTASYIDNEAGVSVDLDAGLAVENTADLVLGEWGRYALPTYGTNIGTFVATIDYRHDYDDPVVLVGPLQQNDPNLATARITSVDAGSFDLTGPIYNKANSVLESVTYMVVERGQWTLADGTLVEADTVVTDHTLGTDTPTQTVTFGQYFGDTSTAPAVFSSVQTASDPTFVNTRNLAVDATTVEVGLETPSNVGQHGADEIVGYVAIQPEASDGVVAFEGGAFDVGTTGAIYDTAGETLAFDVGTSTTPAFLADIATDDGTTPVFLRYQNDGAATVDLYTQVGKAGHPSDTHPKEAVSFLGMSSAQGTIHGAATPDRLFNIENIEGSAYADTLVGNDVANIIEGLAGADVIDGAGGVDTASYAQSAVAVAVDLGAGTASGGDAAGDSLAGIENLIGSSAADTLTGDGGVNTLAGGGLADDAADVLAGGDGDDLFVVTAGGDLISDFRSGDLIDLSQYFANYINFTQLQSGMSEETQADGSLKTVINLQTSTDPIDWLTVVTPDGSSLVADDFVFAADDSALLGSDAVDVLVGGDGHNLIVALRGDDVIEGGGGEDTVVGGGGADTMTLGAGADRVEGLLRAFDGDTLTDFAAEDVLAILHSDIGAGGITLDVTSREAAVLSFDENGDGAAEATLDLHGDFRDGAFMLTSSGTEAFAAFLRDLPDLAPGVAQDDGRINGVTNAHFLTGDGETEFVLTLRDLGRAHYDNVIGVYEIDRAGALTDARILVANANADKAATVRIDGIEEGHQLGFFLVQDDAAWAAGFAAGRDLSFVNAAGEAAGIGDGAVQLAVDGVATDKVVFHSASAALNPDGLQHVISAADDGGSAMTLSFEDKLNGGDRDYEDVAFTIARVEDGDLLA
ncbi:MAG: hypothetical protein AcusKO_47520 [Acuticoccus sp.]